jgi:hypothetical protein
MTRVAFLGCAPTAKAFATLRLNRAAFTIDEVLAILKLIIF